MAAGHKPRRMFSQVTYNCEQCQDTGYIIEKNMVSEYDPKTPVEYAVQCPKCIGKRRVFDDTGIPETYFGADLYHFDFSKYQADMKKIKKITTSFFTEYQKLWEPENKGLYLWSNESGSGKTLLACCLAKSIMIKYNLQMRFISHAEYITQRIEDIERRKHTIEPLAEVYKSCDLLVLDDLGTAKKGTYQEQCLFELLDTRMKNQKMTIFTSNKLYYDLGLDKKIENRMESLAFPIHFPEESIRRKISEDKNRNFIEKILKEPK